MINRAQNIVPAGDLTPYPGKIASLLVDTKQKPFLSKGTPQVASKEYFPDSTVQIDSEENFKD